MKRWKFLADTNNVTTLPSRTGQETANTNGHENCIKFPRVRSVAQIPGHTFKLKVSMYYLELLHFAAPF
jgi:hypothetical protein